MKYVKIYIILLFVFVCSIFFSVKVLRGKKSNIEFDYYIDGTISSEKPIKNTHVFDDYYCVNGLTGYFNNVEYAFIPNKIKSDRCILFFKTITSSTNILNTNANLENKTESTEEKIDNSIEKYNAYLKKETYLYSLNKKNVKKKKIEQYQVVTVTGKNDDYLIVEYQSNSKKYVGMVSSKKVKKLPNSYIEVDISDQYLKIVKKGKRVLMTNIVSGKPSTPTPLGYFEVNGKVTKVYLKGPTWNSYVDYFVPFLRKEYGFHDASWQTSFGGKRYLTNGSHGCVNIAPSMMPKVYEQMEIGMKVIIHE